MDEFPRNSRTTRPAPQENAEKNIKPVAKAVQRKKPLGKRLKESFFGGTTKGVWEYVLADVLLPAARDMVADAASQGVERMVFGEARSVGRRTGARPPISSYGSQPYTRYSTPVGRASGREEVRPVNRTIAEPFDFDDIVIATRPEAETVLERLGDLVDRYGAASVRDLYELVGITGNYTDDKYGWDDLRTAKYGRTRDGYVLDLPRPIPLEK